MDDINESISYDLSSLDAMNRSGLWMLITILHDVLKAVDAMNNPRSWAQGFRWYELLMVIGWQEEVQVMSLGL